MSLLDGLRHIARSTLNRRAVDADTKEELAFHLEQQTRKYIAAGLPEREAARLAKIDLGGLERWREATDRTRLPRYLRDLATDARFAIRGIMDRPAFSLTAL